MSKDNFDTLDSQPTIPGEPNGHILSGRYKIVREIGSGGMGTVYLAEDTELDNMQVAVKVLPILLANNKRAIDNLRREAKTALTLTHPDIVRLHTFQSDEAIKYLVMEYVDGGNLEEKILQAGALSIDETLKIFTEVAAGLDYAHSQNVLHRDIKPANIMLTKDGQVKLADFGIARQLKDSMTHITGKETSGTLLYMAPEQLRGGEPDHRSDIYSLAASIYECLSGHPPFWRGSIEYQIMNEEPAPLEKLNKNQNAALLNALAKEADNRPDTARKFIELLKAKPKPEPKPKTVIEKPKETTPHKQKVDSKKVSILRIMEILLIGMLFSIAIFAIGFLNTFILDSNDDVNLETKSPDKPPTTRTERKRPDSSSTIFPARDVTKSAPVKIQPKHSEVVTNSIGMKLVYIPAGEFIMGSPSNEEGRDDDEGPQHRVRISEGFYMGQTEVTQSQWKSVMGTDPIVFEGDNFPVQKVSWTDAVEFCKKLSQKEGKTYRLPTEAEWEYSCRAGSNTRFSFGNFDTALSVYGWYSNNSANKAHPIGQKKPNAFGLYDMHGNVWEWCSDWYDENYYSSSPSTDPTGPEIGGSRVLRGGSWIDFNPKSCRSAGRFYDRNWDSSFLKANNWGFRIVLEEKETAQRTEKPVVREETDVQEVTNLSLAKAPFDEQKAKEYQKQTADFLGIPVEKAIDLGDGVEMKFALIPAGEFIMGSPSNEEGRDDDEGPQHRVRISRGFYMGQTEVTQAQWRAVTGTNPSYFKGDGLPVELVSWDNAVEFCKKLSQKEGRTYRLPTEAEWEYACRVGTSTPFNTGSTISTSQANYCGNYTYGNGQKGVFRQKTTEVGSFASNSFGLYDMHGNVYEWCSDWYDAKYYSSSPGYDPTGPSTGQYRVLRGGSWDLTPRYCRSANRIRNTQDDRNYGNGFRIVLEEEDWPRGNELKTLEQVTSTQAKLDSAKKSLHQKITPEARRLEYINWLSQAHDVKVSAAEIQKIDRAAPVKATVQPAKPRKLLVFNLCNGFWHSSIPYWDKTLEIMGRKTGAYSVVISKDVAVFEPENLNQFDAVCFNNTTRLKFNPEDTPELCKALMDFVKGGKGIVGIHAATDNFYDWPEAMEMMGSKFTGHPWTSGGTWAIKIDDPGHPLMKTFRGQGFKIQDEIYRTDPPLYSRSKQRVLMSLDMSDPTTRNVRDFKPTDTDTGISWIKAWGKGRIFYCGLGHNHHVVWVPIVLQHCLDGIQFAFGDLKADTK